MCIVEHPGFQAVCLNHFMLQAAWQYKQQYGASAYEESDHKKAIFPLTTGRLGQNNFVAIKMVATQQTKCPY